MWLRNLGMYCMLLCYHCLICTCNVYMFIIYSTLYVLEIEYKKKTFFSFSQWVIKTLSFGEWEFGRTWKQWKLYNTRPSKLVFPLQYLVLPSLCPLDCLYFYNSMGHCLFGTTIEYPSAFTICISVLIWLISAILTSMWNIYLISGKFVISNKLPRYLKNSIQFDNKQQVHTL